MPMRRIERVMKTISFESGVFLMSLVVGGTAG